MQMDAWVPADVAGWLSSSDLPYDAYGVCYSINRTKCTTVTVTASIQQMKFWAIACQKSYQGPCTCACQSDTVRMYGPWSVGQVASLSAPQPVELGEVACDARVADPINTINGNMYQRRVDVSLGTDLGLPLEISRHYNTFNFASSLLGERWRLGFENTLAIDSSNGNLTLTEATGRQVRFERHWLGGTNPRLVYDPPYGVPYRVKVDTVNSIYTIIASDDTRLVFHQAGPVDSIEDLNGNRIRYFFSANILDSVKDASGRCIRLNTSSGRLGSITSSAGDTLVKYEYLPTDDLLHRVTYSDGSWEEYNYGSNSYDPRSITSIVDSDSGKRYFSYDSSGLSTGFWVADGSQKVNLSWSHPSNVECGTSSDSNVCQISHQNGLFTSTTQSVWSADRTMRQVARRTDSDCATCATSFTYDGAGNKRSARYANGRLDSMYYDSRGNLLTRVIAANTSLKQRTDWTYDSTYNRPTLEQWTSINKANDYGKLISIRDSKGNLLRQIESGWKDGTTKYNDTSWFTYNAVGQLTKADGPRRDVADTVKYVYYGNGDLQYEIDANGDTTSYGQRNSLGQRTWVRSANGDTSRYVHDTRGRLTRLVTLAGTADSTALSYAYYVDGSLKSLTPPNGSATQYIRDSCGHLDQLSDQSGNYVAFTYDSMGNQISQCTYSPANVLRKQIFSAYNHRHQPIWTASAFADTTRLGYGPLGTLDTLLDALGNRIVNRHDSLGRLLETIEPRTGDSIKTRYTYDARDNVTKLVDPGGYEYRFKYDDKGRLTYDSCAISGTTRYGYDAADNLAWKKNASGDSIAFKYDLLNRLTAELYPDSQNVRYQYDGTQFSFGKGRLYRESAPACTTTYRYDNVGRLHQEIRRFPSDSTTYTTSYGYDENDQLSSVIYPSGNLVTYQRDTIGNVNMVCCSTGVGWDTLASSITYAPFGDAESWILGNGISISNRLDQLYRIDSISTGVDSLLELRYSYNDVGSIEEIEDRIESTKSRYFEYDQISRLTSARSLDYPDTLLSLIYARNGNRDSILEYGSTADTSAYTYSSNKLIQIVDTATASYSYDALGNVTRVIAGSDTTTYQYTDAGRLVSVDNGATMACTYDGQHQRVSKTSGGVTTKFINLPSGFVLSEFDSADWRCDYIYLNGKPLAKLSAQPSGDIQYYITDHLGTPLALTNNQKTVTWRGDYYPFGEVYDELISSTNPLRFPGQYEDTEADIYYNWNRYYSPRLGRYLQPDPLGPFEGNLYGYANGNPLIYVDPSGESPLLLAAAAWAAVEIGSSLWDAWTTASTLADPCASDFEKGAVSSAFIAGLYLPGGGYSQATKSLIKAGKGQAHHVISKAIFNALSDHPRLKGLFKLRDSRMIAFAKDLASHRGYQDWHRALDKEIAEVILANRTMTFTQFLRYLTKRYSLPDLLKRFPKGIQ
ncbi:MAG: RHS repeat protein [bacterium]|nr:RHS repeat protein [bacterium]